MAGAGNGPPSNGSLGHVTGGGFVSMIRSGKCSNADVFLINKLTCSRCVY